MPHRVFGGFRLYFWMSLPCIYIVYMFFFTPPPVFSGPTMALYFNPHIGYFDDNMGAQYHSVVHSANNIIVCATESFLYGALIILYMRATSSGSDEMRNAFKREKRVSVIFCLHKKFFDLNTTTNTPLNSQNNQTFYRSTFKSFSLVSFTFLPPPFTALCSIFPSISTLFFSHPLCIWLLKDVLRSFTCLSIEQSVMFY
jgi:hypothetical protein